MRHDTMSCSWMSDALESALAAKGSSSCEILRIPQISAVGERTPHMRLGRRPTLRTEVIEKPEMLEKGERRILYMDGINWLDSFWNVWENPWGALRNSDRKVSQFVQAAWGSNFEVVLVADADTKTKQALGKWYKRREEEMFKERKKVSLGVDIFLAESFQKHGIRVMRPLGADADDVLAALAVATSGIVLSKDRDFFRYDRPISVSNGFSVRDGKLILQPTTTIDITSRRLPISRRVQLDLAHAALTYEAQNWSLGVVTKYRPSLMNGMTRRGTSSSSDKTMGNLHVLARPLRAAVYAILGEKWAVEEVPEWSEENEKVVWTATRVAADPSLVPILNTPQSVVAWLLDRDTQTLAQLDPWRAAERKFNICALAAELIVVSSRGAWTMRKCMELFHRQVHSFTPRRHRSYQRLSSRNPIPLFQPSTGTKVIQFSVLLLKHTM